MLIINVNVKKLMHIYTLIVVTVCGAAQINIYNKTNVFAEINNNI